MRKKITVLALAAVLVWAGTPAVAVDDQELQAELDRVAAEIDEVSRRIAAAQTGQSAIAQSMDQTRVRIAALVADLDVAESGLRDVQDRRAAKQADLAEVQDQLQRHYLLLASTRERLSESQGEALAWAREAYMSAGQGMTDLAFDMSAFNELTVGVEYYERATGYADRGIIRLEALENQEVRQEKLIAEEEAQLARDVLDLQDLEAEATALFDAVAASKAAVEAELAAQRSVLAELASEEDHFEKELDQLEAEQEKIERQIAELQDSSGDAPGILLKPVPGAIGSPFGYRTHPILGTKRLHTGIDMSASYGTPIIAAAAGRVIIASWYGGYGNAVVIDHGGGMSTLYAHQSTLDVSTGDTVTAGTTIGLVGSTGLSTGPHLHFEVRINGKPVDPAPYL